MTGKPDSAPELGILVVNWRTPGLAVDCLRSLVAERASVDVRVIVVDNASGDDSVEKIGAAIAENGWQDWVTLIPAPRNGGFAYGNNVAIRAMLGRHPDLRHVLLLNPDTLVRPGALRLLLDFMAAHPQVGVAGGVSEDPDGTPQACCFRFPSALSEFLTYAQIGLFDRLFSRSTLVVRKPREPEEVDWVSGAYVVVRREVIDDIGLLDEGYFLYFEETDFLLRARRSGWRCWHVPASRVVHLVGQSTGVNDAQAGMRSLPGYWFESRRRYFILNHGRLYAMLADIAALAGHALNRIRCNLLRREVTDPPNFVSGLLRSGALTNGRASLKPRSMGP
ncbi:MAG: glycosyltransferase family 2 protein [Steroidobacteraceae bacterium]